MAAQTARMESQEAMFAALEDLKAAGGSEALARAESSTGEAGLALELLVAAGHGEAVVAALDAAQSSAGRQQSYDRIVRQTNASMAYVVVSKSEADKAYLIEGRHPSQQEAEKIYAEGCYLYPITKGTVTQAQLPEWLASHRAVDRAAVGEQLLRKAPSDLVGEIQGFAAPVAPEPRRVRQKREHDAAVAARAPQVDEKERNGDWGEAARPVLELLRRRRAGDAVTIHAVEAALVDAADEEALHVWLQCAIRAPPHAVRSNVPWDRDPPDAAIAAHAQWVGDFGQCASERMISLLYAACCLADVEAVKLLLRHGACIHRGIVYDERNLSPEEEMHPLFAALCQGRSPECALAILEAWPEPLGVDGYPDRDGDEPEEFKDGYWRTPLHDACDLDDDAAATAVARCLVDLGARVDATTCRHDERALQVACERGHATLVAFLLREGADPATPGEQFRFDEQAGIDFVLNLEARGTPLEICEARGYQDCAALIQKALGKAAPKESTTSYAYREDLLTVSVCLGRNFWRYYGLKGKGIGRHRRIASDDAFPETTPAEVDAAFKRLKDHVFDLREYQVERREPELYAKWEEWEESDEGRSWRYNYG